VGEQLTMTGETTPVVEPAVPPLEPPVHARLRPNPASAKSDFIDLKLERATLAVKSLSLKVPRGSAVI